MESSVALCLCFTCCRTITEHEEHEQFLQKRNAQAKTHIRSIPILDILAISRIPSKEKKHNKPVVHCCPVGFSKAHGESYSPRLVRHGENAPRCDTGESAGVETATDAAGRDGSQIFSDPIRSLTLTYTLSYPLMVVGPKLEIHCARPSRQHL